MPSVLVPYNDPEYEVTKKDKIYDYIESFNRRYDRGGPFKTIMDTEMSEKSYTKEKLFKTLADDKWRFQQLEKIFESVSYKEGRDSRYKKALLDTIFENLESEYLIQDTIGSITIRGVDIVKKILAEGLLRAQNPGADDDSIDEIIEGTWDDIKSDNTMRAAIQEKLDDREANNATKALENLDLASDSNGTSEAASAEESNASESNGENLRRAVAASLGDLAPFNSLAPAEVINLRTIQTLNAFIEEKYEAVLSDSDVLEEVGGTVFLFMNFKSSSDRRFDSLKKMKQIQTSGAGSDCLVHTFLTMTCKAFRKLPNEYKNRVARSFRRDLYPVFEETAAVLRDEEAAGESEHRDRIFTVGAFLDDSDIGRLSEIFGANFLIFQNPNREQPALITMKDVNAAPQAQFYTFSNRGNLHFESVRHSQYGFDLPRSIAENINAAGQNLLQPIVAATGCQFNEGDRVQWRATPYYVLTRRMRGPDECDSYMLGDEENYRRFTTLSAGIKDSNPDRWITSRGEQVIGVKANAAEVSVATGGGKRRTRVGRRTRGVKAQDSKRKTRRQRSSRSRF